MASQNMLFEIDHGLTGSYYNNRWLDGAADMIRFHFALRKTIVASLSYTCWASCRIDPQVDFDWGVGLITEHARDFVR